MLSGLFFCATVVQAQSWRVGIHDPSSMVKCKDTYWVFGTGDGIHSLFSTDLVTWQEGPTPFTKTQYPAWINNYVKGATSNTGTPIFHGNFWAPDVIFMNNTYYVYYSCSEWGTMTSTIGCVTNKTLDPADPAYKWQDVGFLGIWSYQPSLALNAIDPSICRGPDGKVWMVYGSFNERGIVITELDTVTGKPKSTSGNLPGTTIANSWTGPNSYDYAEGEGACLVYRNGYYYLFYNKGGCCAGINSSYYIVTGRATHPLGPYYDKQGKNLKAYGAKSGGTVVFKHDDLRGTDDRYYGPGHVGIFNERGTDYVSFHYYDPNWSYPGQPSGGPTLGFAKLVWGSDGWPVISMDFVDPGIYTIRNVNSNKVLDVISHKAVTGAAAFQYAENQSYLSQQWKLTALGTGEYTIRNMADTTLYLMAGGLNNDELLRVTKYYTGAVNQLFRLVRSINGKVIVYPSRSDRLMEIPDANTADSPVKLWSNTNHDCQRWVFTRMDGPSSVSAPAEWKWSVYPNPVGDRFVVEGQGSAYLTVYTLDGQKVLDAAFNGNQRTLDVGHLKPATYLLSITTETDSRTLKFVKERSDK